MQCTTRIGTKDGVRQCRRPATHVLPTNPTVVSCGQHARGYDVPMSPARWTASLTTADTVAVGQHVRIEDGPKAGYEGVATLVRHCTQFGSLIPLVIIDFADGSRAVRTTSSPVSVLS